MKINFKLCYEVSSPDAETCLEFYEAMSEALNKISKELGVEVEREVDKEEIVEFFKKHQLL